MSYRVEYASSGIKRTQIRQRNGRALLLTAVCFLIFLLIVRRILAERGAGASGDTSPRRQRGDGGRVGRIDP